MSENGMHIYTRTPRLRIKYSFTTHRAGESVLILLLKTQQKIICLNKKTLNYKYDTSV
jgi:hypothetical protein